MIRKQFYFTESEDKAVKKVAKESGLPAAEIIRRFIDYCLNQENLDNIIYKTRKNKK